MYYDQMLHGCDRSNSGEWTCGRNWLVTLWYVFCIQIHGLTDCSRQCKFLLKCINMRWEQISVHKLGAYFESFAYFRIHRLEGFSNLMGPDKAIHQQRVMYSTSKRDFLTLFPLFAWSHWLLWEIEFHLCFHSWNGMMFRWWLCTKWHLWRIL